MDNIYNKAVILIGAILIAFFSYTVFYYICNGYDIDNGDLQKITLMVEVKGEKNDRGENKVIITVKNTGYKNFIGKVKLKSSREQQELLAFDVLNVKARPGETAKKVVWLKKSAIPEIKAEICDAQFKLEVLSHT